MEYRATRLNTSATNTPKSISLTPIYLCMPQTQSTMSTLSSLFPELLTRIFQHCSTPSEIVALTSTCKYIYSVWETHSPSIIRDFIAPRILCFDVALMAVHSLIPPPSWNLMPKTHKITGQSNTTHNFITQNQRTACSHPRYPIPQR